MKILLIDAYDSFVYIIYQYFKSLGVEVDVVRNDKLDLATISQNNYGAIVLGPGPGHPLQCGYVDLINQFAGKVPLLGVCLGMQAIAATFGGKVIKAKHLMHGKTSQITHTGTDCFNSLPQNLTVTRYHSLIAEEESFPINELEVLARSSDDNYIMGLKHKKYNIQGVQFHPESVCSERGMMIFQNFIESIS